MAVLEAFGNCPKYLNKKEIRPHIPSPRVASDALPLSQEALALIDNADLFFLSSTNGRAWIQTTGVGRRDSSEFSPTHRTTSRLYTRSTSGNNLYQTLGNFHTNPKVGVAILGFWTPPDVLYLTGETQLLAGPTASAILPHSKLAIKIRGPGSDPGQGRSAPSGGIRESRPLTTLRSAAWLLRAPADSADSGSRPMSHGAAREEGSLSPSIGRFTFELEPEPGQEGSAESLAAGSTRYVRLQYRTRPWLQPHARRRPHES